jgi:hypothetical protein
MTRIEMNAILCMLLVMTLGDFRFLNFYFESFVDDVQ